MIKTRLNIIHILIVVLSLGLIIPAFLYGNEKIQHITIVGAESYPPFEMADIDRKGRCRGIAPDIWQKWSEITNIKITYKCTKWNNVLTMTKHGKADVVGMLFFSRERTKDFEFTDLHFKLPASIFFHRSIYGIKELRDIRGFRIGVINGDISVDYIKKKLPSSNLIKYSTYAELIDSAVKGNIRVFVMDDPVAEFHLARLNQYSKFKKATKPLYSGKVYAGVKKGNKKLLKVINAGFNKTDKNEINKIIKDWTGISNKKNFPWTWILSGFGISLLMVCLILLWNNQLRRKILIATEELQEKKSLLEQSENKFKAIFNDSFQFISLLSTDGTVLSMNRTGLNFILKKREEEIKGIKLWKLLFHDNSHNNRDILQKSIKKAADGSLVRFETIQRSAGGKSHNIDFSLKPICENNSVIFLIAEARDITELKEAEKEKQNLQKKLARSGKMEALGLLAGGVAHDLNNILSGIVTLPEIMLNDKTLSESQRKKLELVRKAGIRASAIVNDLLTISRGSNSLLKPLDLNFAVTEYLNSTEFRKLESDYPNISLEKKISPKIKNITGSSIHIQKTIMNLVVNAYEALDHRHGKVTILTSVILLEKKHEGFELIPPGEYSVVKVANNGPQISEKDYEKIFEPFYSKKIMGRSGTGIGLTLAWNTIKEHSAYIDVLTSPDETSFNIYFPCTDEQIHNENTEKNIQNLKGHGESILVVDDEQAQREILCSILDNLGYRNNAVSSGEEAIEFIKKNPGDIVILDMIMSPGINGKETFEIIKKINPEQKAIIVSGYSETSDIKKTMQLGAGDFIKKPYSIEEIGLSIKKVLS